MLVTRNEKLNGIEITFDGVPSEATRNKLKENHFFWNRKKKVWWTKYTAEKFAFANSLEDDSEPVSKVFETKNEFGVKVGDIFHSTWGYSMYINSFYKVTRITKKSVYVIEVRPKKVGYNGYCGEFTLDPDETWNNTTGEEKLCRVSLNRDVPEIKCRTYEYAQLMREEDFKRDFYEDHMD